MKISIADKKTIVTTLYFLMLPLVIVFLYSDVICLKEYFQTGKIENYDYRLPDFNNIIFVLIKDLFYLLSGFYFFILKRHKWIYPLVVCWSIFTLHFIWNIFLSFYECRV